MSEDSRKVGREDSPVLLRAEGPASSWSEIVSKAGGGPPRQSFQIPNWEQFSISGTRNENSQELSRTAEIISFSVFFSILYLRVIFKTNRKY